MRFSKVKQHAQVHSDRSGSQTLTPHPVLIPLGGRNSLTVMGGEICPGEARNSPCFLDRLGLLLFLGMEEME